MSLLSNKMGVLKSAGKPFGENTKRVVEIIIIHLMIRRKTGVCRFRHSLP